MFPKFVKRFVSILSIDKFDHDMELRQLKYFLKAKELLNFTEAAKQLNVSQSTLSQQIQQLENDVKIPLFNRTGKRVTLTEAGNLFSTFAAQSVSRANDGMLLLNDLNNLNTGYLRIGVTYALRTRLTAAIVLFTEKFPRIGVKIKFGTTNDLVGDLRNEALDFVMTFREDSEEGLFSYKHLLTSPMTLVAAKNSPVSVKESIELKDVARLPLAVPDGGYSTIRFVGDQFRLQGLEPHIIIEIDDIPTLLELVKTGKWFTVLTKISVDNSELKAIPIAGENMEREATIISLKNAYQKKAATAFIDCLLKF